MSAYAGADPYFGDLLYGCRFCDHRERDLVRVLRHEEAEHREDVLCELQDDGLACVVCGQNYLGSEWAGTSVPVGRSRTGSQVFACVGSCAESARAGHRCR